MKFEMAPAKSRGELNRSAQESDTAKKHMWDEEMAVGDDLQTVGVVHGIVGEKKNFRGNEDEERSEAKQYPENGFRCRTTRAGGQERGACPYLSLRQLDEMRSITSARMREPLPIESTEKLSGEDVNAFM